MGTFSLNPSEHTTKDRRSTLLKAALGLMSFLLLDTRRTHSRLRRKEQLYKNLFESATEATCLIDYHDKIILDCNPYFARLTGYTHDELFHLSVLKLVPESERARLAQLYREVANKGMANDVTGIHLVKKNGATVSVTFSIAIIQADSEEMAQVTIKDVSAEEQQRRYLNDLETLNRITLEITSKLEMDELMPKLAEHTVDLAGGDGGFVSLVDKDTGEAVGKYAYNLPEPVYSRCTALTAEAVRKRHMVVIDDYPAMPQAFDDVIKSGVKTALFVPVIVDGEVTAAISIFGFSYEKRFDDYRKNLVEAVARQASTAIEHAMLHQQLNKALTTSNLLLRAANVIGRSLDINETLHELVNIAVRTTGLDHSNIGLYDPEHDEMVVAVSYNNSIPTGLRFKQTGSPEAAKIKSGTWFIADIDDPQVSPQFKEFMRMTNVESALYSPLMYAGKLIGVMCIGSTKRFTFEERQIDISRGIASQATVAIQNAILYTQTKTELEKEHHIAEELQRSLLPQELPEIPFTDLGAYYASSTKEAQVGGDFYDIIALPGNRYAMVIGDVSGKGIEAAASTAMVKCTIRTFLYQYASPSFAFSQANTSLSRQLEQGVFVTVFCIVYDVDTGLITYANAGHPHPCYFNKETGHCLQLASADPAMCLLPTYAYHDHTTTLAPDGFIVTFTDGTLEARRDNEFFGEERLKRVIDMSADLAAQDIADSIIKECFTFARGKLDDDIAILVIKRL
ncbi:MAG: GAF domain-containing SpoIIE family protein phosphatase [Candidatus Aquicultor sp.]